MWINNPPVLFGSLVLRRLAWVVVLALGALLLSTSPASAAGWDKYHKHTGGAAYSSGGNCAYAYDAVFNQSNGYGWSVGSSGQCDKARVRHKFYDYGTKYTAWDESYGTGESAHTFGIMFSEHYVWNLNA